MVVPYSGSMRTARSRTSGENRFKVFFLQSDIAAALCEEPSSILRDCAQVRLTDSNPLPV